MLYMLEKNEYDALMAEISNLKQALDTKTQQLADSINLLGSRVTALESKPV